MNETSFFFHINQSSIDLSLVTDTFLFSDSLGDFVSTGDIEHDYFESMQDGNPVVRTYNNFIINEGHIVTPTNRCKGLYLNILGDLTVNGTLSMTARGCIGEGKYIGIYPYDNVIYYSNENIFVDDYNCDLCKQIIFPIGGIYKVTNGEGVNGANGINGACASGGGSHVGNIPTTEYKYLAGGYGTSFSGGPGAGGNCYNGVRNTASPSTAVLNPGGKGGNGTTVGNSAVGGSGAGNPGGISQLSNGTIISTAESGTGGLMILFVKGNILIGNNGSIQSHGSNGSKGWKNNSSCFVRSGAGSGGGAIHIFHIGDIINSNKITATGGNYGDVWNTSTDNFKSGNGGNGTVNLMKI